MRRQLAQVLATVSCAAVAVGCSAAITQAVRQDAATAMRVKTALVNDPDIGVLPIEVSVADGVATLRGTVESVEDVTRAAAVAGAVDGVHRVDSELQVAGTGPASPSTARPQLAPASTMDVPDETARRPDDRRILGVGAAVTWSDPRSTVLRHSVRISPLVRLGSGRGLGLAVGFGWFGAHVQDEGAAEEALGRIRVRPVMGGLGYSVRGTRFSAGLSLVGGVSFNSVKLGATAEPAGVLLAVDRSLALRPGASIWFDVDDRIAINVFTGYLLTRPRARFLEDGVVVTRSLRADTVIVKAGVVYKVF